MKKHNNSPISTILQGRKVVQDFHCVKIEDPLWLVKHFLPFFNPVASKPTFFQEKKFLKLILGEAFLKVLHSLGTHATRKGNFLPLVPGLIVFITQLFFF